MEFIFYNSNPKDIHVEDCVIRGLSLFLDQTWNEIYIFLCEKGYELKDLPSSNIVWGSFLEDLGYKRNILPNTCPVCYTVKQFCKDFPLGKYLLGTGDHILVVIDGNYYDTWDSGDLTPIYYWEKDMNEGNVNE